MMLLKWTDSMSVGVKQFDREHKRLFQLMVHLDEALQMEDRRGQIPEGEIDYAVKELEKYFRGHLIREENVMARAGYPDIEAHFEEHRHFMTRVGEISHLSTGSTSAERAREIVRFMYEWLTRHIIVTDRKYMEFLNSKDIH